MIQNVQRISIIRQKMTLSNVAIMREDLQVRNGVLL